MRSGPAWAALWVGVGYVHGLVPVLVRGDPLRWACGGAVELGGRTGGKPRGVRWGRGVAVVAVPAEYVTGCRSDSRILSLL